MCLASWLRSRHCQHADALQPFRATLFYSFWQWLDLDVCVNLAWMYKTVEPHATQDMQGLVTCGYLAFGSDLQGWEPRHHIKSYSCTKKHDEIWQNGHRWLMIYPFANWLVTWYGRAKIQIKVWLRHIQCIVHYLLSERCFGERNCPLCRRGSASTQPLLSLVK